MKEKKVVKPKSPMKGVSVQEIQGEFYWYARVGGKKEYCGKGPEGKQRAIDKRSDDNIKKRDRRDMKVGLRPTTLTFKSVGELLLWYMGLEEVEKQKGHPTKVSRLKPVMQF